MRKCGFELDLTQCELGYIAEPGVEGLSPEYFKISSELTFHNALAVSFNNWQWVDRPTALHLQLWNPKPAGPAILRLGRVCNPATPLQQLPTKAAQPASQAPNSLPQHQPRPSSSSYSSLSQRNYIRIESDTESGLDVPSTRLKRGSRNAAASKPKDDVLGTKSPRTHSSSQMQDEEPSEPNAANIINVLSEEEPADDSCFIDTQYLVDHMPPDPKQLPEREDYDSDEEFGEAMDEYLDYIHRLELARSIERSPSDSHLLIFLDYKRAVILRHVCTLMTRFGKKSVDSFTMIPRLPSQNTVFECMADFFGCYCQCRYMVSGMAFVKFMAFPGPSFSATLWVLVKLQSLSQYIMSSIFLIKCGLMSVIHKILISTTRKRIRVKHALATAAY